MNNAKLLYLVVYILITILGWACTEMDITMPKGPKGGKGMLTCEFWEGDVENGVISWPKQKTEITDFFKYLKGKDSLDGKNTFELRREDIATGTLDGPHRPGGRWPVSQNNLRDFWYYLAGASGESGQTPHVGDSMNWWIGNKDTGVRTQGRDGRNGEGVTPSIVTIGDNGNRLIGGVDTRRPSRGEKGVTGTTPTITIGENGDWVISGENTGKTTIGKDGKSPEVMIGTNGSRYVNGRDTDVRAYGKDGADGKDNTNGKGGTNGKDSADGKDGTDGKNGANGKSAYELWVESVEAGCSNTRPRVRNPHNPSLGWDCGKTSLSDFWEFLRGADGRDGADGKDGKSGIPGGPGAEATIIKGIPDIIVLYSQQEFDEYARTIDGGVAYRVYDESGNKTPKAVVGGIPGLDATKTYTANEEGEFIIPKEDLPQIDDVDARQGEVKEVTVNSVTKESAENTCVPNRMRVRMIYIATSSYLNCEHSLQSEVKRKTGPGAGWKTLPSYLLDVNARFTACRVTDPGDPTSLDKAKKIESTAPNMNSASISINPNRYVKENPAGIKNGIIDFWNGRDNYLSIVRDTPRYGEALYWNRVCKMAPYQVPPTLKTLVLIKASAGSGDSVSLNRAQGESDLSAIDFNIISRHELVETVKPSGIDYIEPVFYTPEEAKGLLLCYVKFIYTSPLGVQTATGEHNKSSYKKPEYAALSPYLGATIYSVGVNSAFIYSNSNGGVSLGVLRKKIDDGIYYVENAYKNIPEINVTYKDK